MSFSVSHKWSKREINTILLNGRQEPQKPQNDFDHSRKFLFFWMCAFKFIMCDRLLHWANTIFFWHSNSHTHKPCCYCSRQYTMQIMWPRFSLSPAHDLSFFGRLSFVSMFAVVCDVCCNLTYIRTTVYSNVVWSRDPLIFVCESFSICTCLYNIIFVANETRTTKPVHYLAFFRLLVLFCFILSISKLY